MEPDDSDAQPDLLIRDLLDFVYPLWSRGHKPKWPPDAFAIAAALLKNSGAYTEVVNKWPPSKVESIEAWHEMAIQLRDEWRELYSPESGWTWPTALEQWWDVIIQRRETPIRHISDKDNRDVVDALTGIIAAADQTSFGFGIMKESMDVPDLFAMYYLQVKQTLCKEVHASRVTVLPKLHNPLSGITLRSLTHNLAFWDRMEVRPSWKQLELKNLDSSLNLLLLPWPLVIEPNAFQSFSGDCGGDMPEEFGLFTYTQRKDRGDCDDHDAVPRLVEKATKLVGQVDAVIFPELSMSRDEFLALRKQLTDVLVIAGVGTEPTATSLGNNQVAMGLELADAFQSKHHRWRLDISQIEQYGLGSGLAPKHCWWEAIEIPQRECTFVSVNAWLTFCVLICEDLARQDPVAELIRSVGPNLVIVLLLDGPQIPERWSARYATVLAEDPRSSVLTLTSAGLVDLARSQRPEQVRGPRSIGLWKDALSGSARQIVLEQGSKGVVLNLRREMAKEWAADGRHDDGSTGYLRLTGIHQIVGP